MGWFEVIRRYIGSLAIRGGAVWCGVGALAPLEYAYYVLLSISSHLVRGLVIIVVL